MKFDARVSSDPTEQEAFLEWLVAEAASGFSRSRGDRDSLRAPLLLYLSRAYEAHLDPGLIADLIGASKGCILDRAGLSKVEESAVIDEYETIAPTIEAMYKDV